MGSRKEILDCRKGLESVIFFDECKIIVGENNRVFVSRKPGEEWLPQCLSPGCKAKMSWMIWGCITFNGVGTLTTVNGNTNAAKYIEILEDNLWPVIVRHYPEENYIFQDDNAPVYRARSVQNYKIQNNINGMSWLAQSPDVNIIENCWLLLKNSLQKQLYHVHVHNVTNIVCEIMDIWQTIPLHYIRNLYRSLPTRMLKIIRSKARRVT